MKFLNLSFHGALAITLCASMLLYTSTICGTTIALTDECIMEQNSISSYLKTMHSEIDDLKNERKYPSETIHIILGNQSADMDSIASAIAFSYSNNEQGIYIPVINIQRDELPLRGDVLHVFKTLKIDPNTLLYQEDIPFLLNLAEQGYVRFTLVDHNRLAPDQECLKNYIEKIIDHHEEEDIVYPLLKEEDKLITKMASNSTLVGRSIFSSAAHHCSSEEAYLLLSAILLDTGNLQYSSVTTEEDVAIATLLKEKAGKYYDDTLFDVLIKSRHAIEHLTPELLLKKDYKLYKEGKFLYGIASIPQGVRWMPENRLEWKEAFTQSFERQNIHFLSALAYSERTFIVYIPSQIIQDAFFAHMQETAVLHNELVLINSFPEEGLFFFELKAKLTRKQLQPFFSFENSAIIQHAANL